MHPFLTRFLAVFIVVMPGVLQAEERPAVYPFDVTLGGQKAVVEGNPSTAIVAEVPDPVKADAKLQVEGKPGMIIINVFPAKANGEVASDAQPKIIMAQNGTETSLANTMDDSKLDPGIYLANIVFNNATSRILFTIK